MSFASGAGALRGRAQRGAFPLERLCKAADHSWLRELTPDPETEACAPNKQSRQVRSGHYVLVRPTPLPRPKLIIHSASVAEALGISDDEVNTDEFVCFFSGDQGRASDLQSWCTPYALSIMGQPMFNNCPYGNGNGYGDGRAISIGEVVIEGQRLEIQIKGAGTTPFCRGADGRAVLRSSIREFLASEAMHHLGVESTRALCLIVSGSENVQRPWYSGRSDGIDFFKDPDTMITEPCAITTRVAPSFMRIGHIDLFARRVMMEGAGQREREELEQILQHALNREYPSIAANDPLEERTLAFLEAVAERIAVLVAGWLRVGFCQGNFNSDNCLVGGRTMDYGPFGWIDIYDPHFAKWTGSGKHYAFMNQPGAAIANYLTLVRSMLPLLGEFAKDRGQETLNKGVTIIQTAAVDVWRAKMGFSTPSETAADLWVKLEPLMRRSKIDFTIFWRQLAQVVQVPSGSAALLMDPIMEAFYECPSEDLKSEWISWLLCWHEALSRESGGFEAAATRLLAANPKYVPREWMLAAAYQNAAHGDYSLIHELHNLFLKPYDEQPHLEAKYYRRVPSEALAKGGIAHMS